jgi:hypothetical protein
MFNRSIHLFTFVVIFITVSLLFTLSCNRERQLYTGTYLLLEADKPESSETYIQLKENGIGIWNTPDDEVSFRWDVKDNEIRLHTKLGGVLIGKIHNDTLEIVFPGSKIRRFKKQGNI